MWWCVSVMAVLLELDEPLEAHSGVSHTMENKRLCLENKVESDSWHLAVLPLRDSAYWEGVGWLQMCPWSGYWDSGHFLPLLILGHSEMSIFFYHLLLLISTSSPRLVHGSHSVSPLSTLYSKVLLVWKSLTTRTNTYSIRQHRVRYTNKALPIHIFIPTLGNHCFSFFMVSMVQPFPQYHVDGVP